MNLLLGENIKRMRLCRNLTQEEVASHIGVSSQSVSKWERGEGYPDIEMLPSVANYFGVSIDELLGMSEAEKEKRYNEINSIWAQNNKNRLNQENVQLMRDALKTYPNDALLLVQLSTSLEKLDGTPQEKEKNLRKSIAVQEQIINYCDDCEVRGATLFNICFAYNKIGEHEKAVAQAKKLPNLYKTRENALVCFLDGEEKNAVAREALLPLGWAVSHHFSALAETENNKEYLKKAAKIIDIIFEDDKDVFVQKIYDGLLEKLK